MAGVAYVSKLSATARLGGWLGNRLWRLMYNPYRQWLAKKAGYRRRRRGVIIFQSRLSAKYRLGTQLHLLSRRGVADGLAKSVVAA